MCELMGLSANKRIRINEELRTFYSHSVNHHNGWGLAILDADPVFACKEADRALDSPNLKKILACDITTSSCIAHIRRATIGEINAKNSHPFSGVDASGRRWILAHNGTIFEAEVLSPYSRSQQGTTDSERIFLYLMDLLNEGIKEKDSRTAAASAVILPSTDRLFILSDILRIISYHP